jgi:acetylglutamate kinase
MKTVYVVKVGGNIIDDELKFAAFLCEFSELPSPKLLIHGGGKLATQLASRLGHPTKIISGRRVTDEETLKIAIMVYAGWINKTITAKLQAFNCKAIGISGADGRCIPSVKRRPEPLDYGFVGDPLLSEVDVSFFSALFGAGLVPVISPITADESGQLLNTNADTVASVLASAMSKAYHVKLVYCFEEKGVLKNKHDKLSVIPKIDSKYYEILKSENIVAEGMIPKLDNAFQARQNGVGSVIITNGSGLLNLTKTNYHAGTTID